MYVFLLFLIVGFLIFIGVLLVVNWNPPLLPFVDHVLQSNNSYWLTGFMHYGQFRLLAFALSRVNNREKTIEKGLVISTQPISAIV